MAIFLNDSYHSKAIKFLSSYIEYEYELALHHKSLSDCTLPALVQEDGVVVSGLCHVARGIILSSATKASCVNKKKNIEALLVFEFFL